ncbi:hypothetical protein EXIGLDRAFT_601897 [Exidia glandulosa HHB12029]|uniref:Uncharacterized protein n=1 Tax=Exidia glandulosa HHB12029 TaxID=1314781 RepID=A0A166BM83_EXIGL|nr:hypothetical protein EXIGLDRAFT_601897 [Exidia glandulosa HHB12029]
MIADLSKAIILYLAPLLALTSFLLNLFVFLAPTVLFNDSVSLASVTPALLDLATNASVKAHGEIDGPSLYVGLLGSCARKTNKEVLFCTTPSFAAVYNTSVLPTSIPNFLTAPVSATPVFAILALLLFAVFLPLFTLSALREKLPGKMNALFSRPMLGSFVAWAGVLSWLILAAVYLVMRMWLGRSVEDINAQIVNLGKGAPQLHAEISNGFTMIWVAQAFAAVPVVCSLMKLHMSNAPVGKV